MGKERQVHLELQIRAKSDGSVWALLCRVRASADRVYGVPSGGVYSSKVGPPELAMTPLEWIYNRAKKVEHVWHWRIVELTSGGGQPEQIKIIREKVAEECSPQS